jgi:prepilin-type N-terminal cleavage/methylation domain-containing protein
MHTSKNGFTLIEMMVSVAIFSIVMVVALGSLLAISAADRKAQTLKTVMDNLSFAMEGMSRTIRTGVNYHCDTTNMTGSTLAPQDCPGNIIGAQYFAFIANDGTYTAYCLNNNQIWRQRSNTMGGLKTSCSALDGFLPITAPEIVISNLSFYVKGAPLGDGIQPKTTMILNGFVNINSTAATAFALQATVTQRIYDQ